MECNQMTLLEKNNSPKATRNSESGFSLLEMIIAMVIFIIVTGSIYGLLSMGRVSKDRSSRRTDVLKNARAAIHLIGRDALNAGLGYHQAGALVPDGFLSTTLSLPTDTDNTRDILTSIIAGDNIFPNNLQTGNTDIIAFAYRDQGFNGGDSIGLDQSLPGSASTVVRLQLDANSDAICDPANCPTPPPPPTMNRHDLVLVESDTTQVAVMVTNVIDNKNVDFATNDPLGINQARDGAGVDRSLLRRCNPAGGISDNCTTNISSLKRFFWVSYEVKPDGTLVRKTYGNNTGQAFDQQVQERPIAYNVRDLQFTYVLENGTVTNNPGSGPDGIAGTTDDTPNDFNLIRQVTVTIEVQSTENDEQTGQPISITLRGTFSTRNLEYDVG